MTTDIPTWRETITVRDYETDFNGRWKPSSFFRLMQLVAGNQSTSIGFNFYELMDRGMAWVLSRVRINIAEFPKIDERIIYHTWLNGVQQKLFFIREFDITTIDGKRLARATTASILIDPHNRRILSPRSLPGHNPEHAAQVTVLEPLDKLDVPEGMPAVYQLQAAYSDLDVMGHVNNANYIDWVCSGFPLEKYRQEQISRLQLNFLHEVKAGDAVTVSAASQDEGGRRWSVSGENGSGERAFEAVVDWQPRAV